MTSAIPFRRALLVLDMQNEFLAPTGRCKITNKTTPDDVPPFVDNILRVATAFRQTGKGDVIWVRSEFEQPRDVNEEKIWLYAEEDEEEEDKTSKENTGGGETKKDDRIGKFDEFLSCATNPYCAKGSEAASFHESVMGATKTPGDRTLKKTWYSAFKNTGLVEILRGRITTELFICGLKTNTSVYATVSDAVRHGFKVTILSDCLGHSDQKLHDVALSEMTGVLGCEVIRSVIMVRSWAAKSRPAKNQATAQPTAPTKEDLTKMIEKLTLNGENVDQGDETEVELVEPQELDKSKNTKSVKDIQRQKVNSQDKDQSENKASSIATPSPTPPAATPSPTPSVATPPPGHKKIVDRSSEALKKQSPARTPSVDEGRPMRKMRNVPAVLKDGDVIGEGDTRLVKDILPPELGEVAFERLRREVRWRTMLHRGGEVPRLVAVEGSIDEDGSFPIYRHPADESPPLRPFSPTVSIIRDHVQKVLNHPVNHVLIQYYRGGNDYISEHSDKTLDIVRGSNIVNVSLGAQRTMILRTKKDSKEWMESRGKEESSGRDSRQDGKQPGPPRTTQRIPLPHNSMFILGEATNRKWLHAIKQDRRLPTLLSNEEAYNGGERISLTFRHIGTFLTDNETKIWGHGATGKTREEAKSVLENNMQEVERMIYAFGTENHQAEEFDWDGVYGGGFDVLHFKNRLPKLYYTSQTSIGATRVLLALSEKGIDVEVEVGERKPEIKVDGKVVDGGDEDDISLVDVDIDRTTVKGSIPILLYLETFYTGDKALGGIGKHLFPRPQRHDRGSYAQVLSILLESEKLRKAFEEYRKVAFNANSNASPVSNSQEQNTDSSQPSVSPSDTNESQTGTLSSQLSVNAARIDLQDNLDYFRSQLYRISLGPSGRALGLTKGEEDVCFGGLGTKKCWSVADCAIWPVLRSLETWLPDGGAWTELGHDGRWAELRNYYKLGWERSNVRRVFRGLNKTGEEKKEKKEPEPNTLPRTVVEIRNETKPANTIRVEKVEADNQEEDTKRREMEEKGDDKQDGVKPDRKTTDEGKPQIKADGKQENEEKPIEEKPPEGKPVEKKAVEEKSVEEKVVEEKPVEVDTTDEKKAEVKLMEDKLSKGKVVGEGVDVEKGNETAEDKVDEERDSNRVKEAKINEEKAHTTKANEENIDPEETDKRVIDKNVDTGKAAEDVSTQK